MGAPRTPDARASVAWLRRFVRTTPGVVSVIAVAVAACCVIAGVVVAGQLDGRIAEHDAVLDHSEPFAYAAQNLYVALSAADAAAASAYLAGLETPALHARYQQALADAASALADATAGATDANTRTSVAQISAQLAAYTGLIEAARANNRQGYAVGSAYLREASSLMQNSLLPGAEKIFTANLAAVDQDQRAVGSTPVIGLALLAFVLVAIVVGSLVLSRRTNRQFNLGLVVAATLVLVVIAWVVGATRLASSAIEHSRTDGTARFEELAKARILAQQARTDETLLLIARGDITAGQATFLHRIDDLTKQLDSVQSAAVRGVKGWAASHGDQVLAYQHGDYAAAVADAIGTSPNGSAAQFAIVETSLRDEIEQTRSTLRERVATAGTFLAWSPTGTLVLMVFAAAATLVGLWPRLEEFL
ncbi:MAG: hypothetical protein QOK02_5042 [Mycobacterium sp.]|jgi:hypothetical protein|nr:hypothetical protein [Mycobacterium sp.]